MRSYVAKRSCSQALLSSSRMGRLYSRGYNIFARAQPNLLLLQVSSFEDVSIALACAQLDFTPFLLLLYLRRPWLRWYSSLGAQLPDWLIYALRCRSA